MNTWRFGRLTAIERVHGHRWKFRCDCGNVVTRDIYGLQKSQAQGRISHCGCMTKERAIADCPVGEKFGALTVIAFAEHRASRGNLWLFRCDCGNEVTLPGPKVRYKTQQGLFVSCGCHKPGAKPFGVAAREDWLHRYMRGAADRNISWELTDEQAYSLFEQDCHYCGAPPAIGKSDRFNGAYAHNGIDRMDSSQGYTVENCVPCCSQCNFLKLSMPYEEFVAWLDRLVEFRMK
jgi:hypothetical protein